MSVIVDDVEIIDAAHSDKILVTVARDPSILKRLRKENPELYDEALNIIQICASNDLQAISKDIITVELHIEERSRSRDPIDFECSPNWTVFSVKIKISEQFNFDLDSLYILCKRTIAKDCMYLKQCGVEEQGDALYVYIHIPQKSKTRGMSHANMINRLAISQNSLLQNGANPIERQQSESKLSINAMDVFPEQKTDMMAGENFDITDNSFIGAVPRDHKDMGKLWTCPHCTFLNESWRPGCCMCAAPKPIEYSDVTETLKMIPESSNENMEEAPLELKAVARAEEKLIIGWRCPQCTFLNQPTRPGCEICSVQRPEDYHIPDGYVLSVIEKERMDRDLELEKEVERQHSLERKQNYEKHISVVEKSIITSVEPVECMICFTEADPADTIVLRECLHRFCKDCITQHIVNSEEAVVSCPFADEDYNCDYSVTQREIKALLSDEDFQKYLDRGLRQAEKASPNSFHCKTPDCPGWCEYEDQVNTFHCPVCEKRNCLTCKAIHEDLNCKQYQDELELKSATDKEAQQTRKLLDRMVKNGEAMHCPQCNIIIQKKVGCDWIRCPMCKLEICWVTKGPRWGPKGRGDTSGGCHCKESGKPCHKDCANCH